MACNFQMVHKIHNTDITFVCIISNNNINPPNSSHRSRNTRLYYADVHCPEEIGAMSVV
jgi:hypothetical protein